MVPAPTPVSAMKTAMMKPIRYSIRAGLRVQGLGARD
jgi:hypothetical protein